MELKSEFIQLIEYFCSYGFDSLSSAEQYKVSVNYGDPVLQKKYLRKIHEGWKIGQEIVFQAQHSFWKKDGFLQSQSDKYSYRNLQRLIDTIIWSHFWGDGTDIKRVVTLEPETVNLLHHNIYEHKRIADDINQNLNQFALISDLSSGANFGDLMVLTEGDKRSFIEVKSGKINHQIMEALKSSEEKPEQIPELVKNKKTNQQLKRMIKQQQHALEMLKILHDGNGKDKRFPKTSDLHIHEISNPLETFNESLNILLDQSEVAKTGIADAVIDNCLLIAVINKEKHTEKELKNRLDKLIADFQDGLDHGRIIFNWGFFLNRTSFTKPIFLQPIAKRHVHDIVALKKEVIFCFDFERFRNEFNGTDMSIELVTGKEFRRLKSKYRGFAAHSPKSILKFSSRGQETPLSGGIFHRIPSTLIRPSAVRDLHQVSLDYFA